MNRWFLPFDFHTRSFMQARLQFPFAFRRIQSLQLLPPAHPCFLLSFLASLGPPFHGFYTASFRLSDPRCFRVLSNTSVLGSDYSASVSSFPFSSCLSLTVASSVLRLCFRFRGFPRSFLPSFPCIIPRFWYSAVRCTLKTEHCPYFAITQDTH